MGNEQSIKRYIIRDVHGNILKENGFSVMGAVHVTVEPGHGEPSAVVEYVGGELYLTLHNIDGNGITEIVTDYQEGDEAVNTVTIKTDDNPEGVVLEVRNGSKGERGNGITSIEQTVVSTEDGGENVVTVKTTDNPSGVEFKFKNGRKGATGDTVAYGASDLLLSNVLGNSTIKAMTQKGVTDMVMNNFVSEWKQKTRDKDTQAIYPQNGSFVSGSNNNHIHSVAVNEGDIVKVSVANSNYGTAKGNISFSSVLPALGGTYETLFTPTPVDASTYEAIIIAPGNGYVNAYIYSGSSMSCKFYTPVSIGEKVATDNAAMQEQFEQLEDSIEESIGGLSDILEVSLADITPPTPTSETATGSTDRIDRTTSSSTYGKWVARTSTIWGWQKDISAYTGKKLKITVGSKKVVYAFLPAMWKSSDRNTNVVYCQDESLHVLSTLNTTETVTIPSDAVALWILWHGTTTSGEGVPTKVEIIGTITDKLDAIKAETVTYHVDEANGSDENNGLTAANALKTVAKAVAMSGSDVSIELHGTLTAPIVITGKNAVRIKGNGSTVHVGTEIDSAELASGYDDVYEKTFTLPAYNTNYGLWLWQKGVSDERTAITQAERHPSMGKSKYRLPATKIALAASVAAVAAADEPSYYYDSANHKLYFKIVEGTELATNPVVVRAAEEDYAINIQCNELLMSRVTAAYGTVMLEAIKAELIECRSIFGCHGFRNNSSYGQNIYLRCEAGGCFASSGNGDGFGGGTSRSTLIDCWAHDCFDDGYSEHSGSRSTIIGGLFEYCGKGGIVPSGMYISIIGATCRHNGGRPDLTSNGLTGGIYCVKGASDISVNGYTMTVDVKDCVCYDNNTNFFIGGSDNNIILSNCQSINAAHYGYLKGDGATMTLRNCTHYGTGTARNSSSAITIQNGTIVS